MSDDEMYWAKQRQAFHRRAGKPSRSYPIAAEVICINGEPSPSEADMQIRVQACRDQLDFAAKRACELLPPGKAIALIELVLANAKEVVLAELKAFKDRNQ